MRAPPSIGDIVTRAISGYAKPEMQRHYSTMGGAEPTRANLAKVIDKPGLPGVPPRNLASRFSQPGE